MDMRVVQPPIDRSLAQGESDATTARQSFDTRDLGRMAELVLRRIRLIAAIAACGLALSLFSALFLLPSYTAKALIAVGEGADTQASAESSSAIDTHVALLSSKSFLAQAAEAMARDPALARLKIRAVDLERRLRAQQELKSRLIAINFSSRSPEAAAAAANLVAQLYVRGQGLGGQRFAVEDGAAARLAAIDAALRAKEAEGESGAVADLRSERDALALDLELARRQAASRRRADMLSPPVQIAAPAERPEKPSSLNPVLIVAPGLLGSLIAAIGLALMLGRLDPRVRTASDIAESLAAPCLGATPAGAGAQDAVDQIAATLVLDNPGRQNVVIVTSGGQGNIHKRLATQLARSAARFRPPVLLVELDSAAAGPPCVVHRPSGASYDRFDGSSLIGGERSHSVDLRVQEIVRNLSVVYEWVIIDAPPVARAPETRLLARWATHVVLAARANVTTKAELAQACAVLGAVGGGLERAQVSIMLTDAGGAPAQATTPTAWRRLQEFVARATWSRRSAAQTPGSDV